MEAAVDAAVAYMKTLTSSADGNLEILQDDINGWSYTDASKTAIILDGNGCHSLKTVTYTGFQFISTCATGVINIS